MVRQAEQGDAQRRLWPRGEPALEQAPGRTCGPMERGAHAGASFAGRTCDPAGDPRWSSLCLKGCTPWEEPTLENFMKNCTPWERLMLEKFVENCLLWEEPHAGAGEECKESSSWGGSGRDSVWWSDHSPHSPPTCVAQGEEGENSGVKLSPGRREGWGEGVLRFGFIFYYPTLTWLVVN